jgi:hypothetical protein
MGKIIRLVLILVLCIAPGCSPYPQQPKDGQEDSVSKERRIDAMKTLVREVESDVKVARIEYRGTCDMSNSERIDPPFIELSQASASLSGIERLRAMLRRDQDTAITQSTGMTRIRINTVTGSILDTNLQTITLTPNQQYNPQPAIWAFENHSEIQNSLQHLNARFALSMGGLETVPSPNLPHLEPSMSHLTFDEALDRIARTFSGVVVYKECVRPGKTTLITIEFDGY